LNFANGKALAILFSALYRKAAKPQPNICCARCEQTFSAPTFVHVGTILKGSPSTAQRKRSATLGTQNDKNSINSEGVAQKALLAFEETSGNNYGHSEFFFVALFQSAVFSLDIPLYQGGASLTLACGAQPLRGCRRFN